MQINDSLWARCEVKTVDHVAVTTSDLKAVMRDYLGLPGSELVRGPGFNSSQNVDYAFIKTASGMMVEILGVRKNSPISEHVEKGGGAYHLCFSVEDLDKAILIAKENAAIEVVKPGEDDAFDGRRVAFLIHPDHGLFEFLETYPKDFKTNAEPVIESRKVLTRNVKNSNEAIDLTKRALTKLFPELKEDSEIESAEYDVTPGWGSFKHLQLFMEIEQQASVSFTADEITQINDFESLVENLKRKLEE